MKRSKLTLAVSCAVMAALIAVGCGSSDDSSGGSDSGGKLKVAYAGAGEQSSHWLLLKKSIEEAADVAGVDLSYYNNDLDATTAVSNARLIAQEKPDVVLSYNGVESASTAVEKQFADAGIPCVAVNAPGNGGCDWFNFSNEKLCTDVGTVIGKEAAKRGWNGDNTSVILVNAPAFGEVVNSGIGYFYTGLQKEVPGIDTIDSPEDIELTTTKIGDNTFQVDGQVQAAASFDAVNAVLQQIPKDRNIILYALDTDSTVGAWRAIEKSGRASTTLTGGLGGYPNGLKNLRENDSWVVEGDTFMGNWGPYLIAMATAIHDGVKPPAQTTAPEAALTKDLSVKNTLIDPIDKFYAPGAVTPKLLPKLEPVVDGVGNSYLKETGILQKFNIVDGLK